MHLYVNVGVCECSCMIYIESKLCLMCIVEILLYEFDKCLRNFLFVCCS